MSETTAEKSLPLGKTCGDCTSIMRPTEADCIAKVLADPGAAYRVMIEQDAEIERLRAVLARSRTYIGGERMQLLESFCILGPDGPRIETLSADDRENFVAPVERLIAKIDEALS
jgi:hypothetical protein